MAHFAELNGSKQVIRVVVVGNDIQTSDGLLGSNDIHGVKIFLKVGLGNKLLITTNLENSMLA